MDWDKIEKVRNTFYFHYYNQHKACPKCGTTKIYTTCITPFVLAFDYNGNLINPDAYRDINIAECINCNWSGRVHELKPEIIEETIRKY